ncbi:MULTISPECIES: type II secretion system protein GspM [unclassified Rhizobium]|uniref:type II secretion system protein GspM n=1 Tax=unclassified Rhizobium TaxID=2613769 RepID=UPI001049C2CB|nr:MULTISPECIES: type II secretion system protein GspM [unclassified Rhizobium]TCM76247.1 type II secretion system (T2SS) protein M subtype b [Rhizobium sp. BK068]
MNRKRGSAKNVRAAVIAVLAALLLVPGAIAAWSLMEARHLSQANAEQQLSLDALKAKLAALEDSSANDADGDGAAIYLAGDTSAVAGAELQRLMTEMISQTGAKIAQFEFVEPAEGASDDGTVEMRVLFETTTEPLQQILFATESNRTALVFKSITIESAESSVDNKEPPSLRVSASVEGYWRRSKL